MIMPFRRLRKFFTFLNAELLYSSSKLNRIEKGKSFVYSLQMAIYVIRVCIDDLMCCVDVILP